MSDEQLKQAIINYKETASTLMEFSIGASRVMLKMAEGELKEELRSYIQEATKPNLKIKPIPEE